MLAVLAFNLVGDARRDLLDPASAASSDLADPLTSGRSACSGPLTLSLSPSGGEGTEMPPPR